MIPMEDSQIIKIYDKLSEVSERIARLEAMLQARVSESERILATLDEHEERIASLEENKAKFFGAKEFVAWLIAVGIAVWGCIK